VRNILTGFVLLMFLCNCKKNNQSANNPSGNLTVTSISVNDSTSGNYIFYNVRNNPTIKIHFSQPIDKSTVSGNITLMSATTNVPLGSTFSNNDSVLIVQTSSPLKSITYYIFRIATGIKSTSGGTLQSLYVAYLTTQIDTTNKFPIISDSALLTLVQQQTFKYFWDFGHPVSGMARERNTSGDVVTTGGSGFGVMAILVGIKRNFVARPDALARITQIVNFLSTKAQRYHGAFPHWMDGTTGATIPFSDNDDGADIVETSYMMQGLLCARQYFNSTTDAGEIALRNTIDTLWNGVDWNWFRQGGQNVLYWHWSPDKGWIMNVQIRGWNEALITYVLAASSNTDSIPSIVYSNGWAQNGAIKNGNLYYGIQLSLGVPYGGPLFFAHYSFLGINPNGLSDAYANYWTQNVAHSTINYDYCVANPLHFNGYNSNCWGLTASDENNGYSAHAPGNDDGVISPTAAISSLPYTPTQSMNALHFFYYKLGDKIWGTYGFVDAFNLSNIWFANSYLAIDQGPEIVMIENYRSGMLWNLFMSCPEVKRGMHNLGFSSPYL